jgi:hypothetical protein
LLGHRKLSDIVQQCRRPQRLPLRSRQTQIFSHFHGVNTDAAKMSVRGVILGFDGQRQRFDGTQMQCRHFNGHGATGIQLTRYEIPIQSL